MTRRTRSKPEKRLTAVSEKGEIVKRSLEDSDRPTRVRRIIELMAAGEWDRGKTGPELAREMGVSEHTLRAEAGVVSIILNQLTGDLDRLDQVIQSRLLEVAQMDPTTVNVVGACRTLMERHGLLKKGLEISGGIDVGRKTDEDLARGAVARREDRELIYRVLREGGYTTEALEALS